MAITINEEPEDIDLARNMMPLELESDNLVLTPGVKEKQRMSFSGGASDTETIQFVYGSVDITMTITASFNNSGLVIPETGATALEEWVDEVFIHALRSNYRLNEDWVITRSSGNGVTPVLVDMEAKTAGTEFSCVITESCANMSASQVTAAVDEVRVESYKHFVDLYVEDTPGSGTYEKAVELANEPNTDGISIFYLDKVLKSFLSPALPAFALADLAAADNILKNYYYRYAEYFLTPGVDDEPQVRRLYGLTESNPTPKQALYAGVSRESYPSHTFIADYLTAATGRKFLTKQPREKTIGRTQKEFLYFYNDGGDVRVYADVFYTNGTSSLDNLIYTADSDVHDKVMIIPAGYTQMGIATIDATKTVQYYQIRVQAAASSTVISELMTYYVDYQVYQVERYLLFQNSAGGMDTLRCIGADEESIEVSGESAEVIEEYDYTATTHAIKSFNNFSSDKLTLNTGPLPVEYAEALRDLLLSEHVWEITSAAFVPVRFDKREARIKSSRDNYGSIELELSRAFFNQNYGG